MSILYLVVSFIILICFYRSFKRTLILYAPFKLIFHSGIFLVDSSFSLNLDLAISMVAFVFFLYMPKRVKGKEKVPTLLLIGWGFYLIGLLLHAIRPSIKPTLFLQEAVTTFLYCYMLFETITRKSDLSLLLKGFIIVSIIMFVDAMIDIISGVNLITTIEESQAGSRFWHSTNTIARVGMMRTTSFMPHALTMGCLASLLCGFIYKLVTLWNVKVDKKYFYFSLVCLILCVIFSNSRSSLIAFVLMLPMLLDYKSTNNGRIFLVVAFIIVVVIFYDYFYWMYDSIANENRVDVQGSTSELRDVQYNTALYWMMKNPIWGNGNSFQVLNYEDQSLIMGMESVWFPIMMQQGLCGVITYIILIIMTTLFFVLNKMKMQVFFVASWVAIITLSSQIGLSLFLFVLFPLMNYKAKLLNARK